MQDIFGILQIVNIYKDLINLDKVAHQVAVECAKVALSGRPDSLSRILNTTNRDLDSEACALLLQKLCYLTDDKVLLNIYKSQLILGILTLNL